MVCSFVFACAHSQNRFLSLKTREESKKKLTTNPLPSEIIVSAENHRIDETVFCVHFTLVVPLKSCTHVQKNILMINLFSSTINNTTITSSYTFSSTIISLRILLCPKYSDLPIAVKRRIIFF